MSEDLKKNFLSSRYKFTAKRWQGKPLLFKLKYCLANYPELLVSSVLLGIISPAIYYYKSITYEGSRAEALKKFKINFVVMRDDEPGLDEILKEKELGRDLFPK